MYLSGGKRRILCPDWIAYKYENFPFAHTKVFTQEDLYFFKCNAVKGKEKGAPQPNSRLEVHYIVGADNERRSQSIFFRYLFLH